jgi:hypothetical protein
MRHFCLEQMSRLESVAEHRTFTPNRTVPLPGLRTCIARRNGSRFGMLQCLGYGHIATAVHLNAARLACYAPSHSLATCRVASQTTPKSTCWMVPCSPRMESKRIYNRNVSMGFVLQLLARYPLSTSSVSTAHCDTRCGSSL